MNTLCIVPDPCLFQPCDSNALCERDGVLNENFTCTCLSPFVGNGFNCTSKFGSLDTVSMHGIIVADTCIRIT